MPELIECHIDTSQETDPRQPRRALVDAVWAEKATCAETLGEVHGPANER
jgi:hypothetical protein